MQRIKNIIGLDNLKEWYIYANTPMYLYQHFREDDSIRNLADKFGINELTKIFNYYRTLKKQSLENVIISYAVLVALTFKDTQLAEKAFKKIDLSDLQWGNDIQEIFLKNITKSNFYNLNARPIKKIDVPSFIDNGHISRSIIKVNKLKNGHNKPQFENIPSPTNYSKITISKERQRND